ncbi:pentatricopeptide repeat-containing protein At4g13650-like [Phragmites australis]|uniref:pentatricopeptide repeat-containing protein At4g13650-like n=1 Tax=Phragmites australis TaxID=29695 RepID=UPI002D776802|nr:pentatricopeptide repeat-containing protein At4g13650-like [Phragmites australis]
MHDHLAALLRGGGGGGGAHHPRAIHGAAVKLGCIASTFLCNKLLLAYLRRPLLSDARMLFDEMPRRNLASWYILISGSARLGALEEAFVLLSDILYGAGRGSCDRPDSFTLGALAVGCARARDIVAGAQVHACAVKFGVDEDESVAGALVDTYAKCWRVDSAWRAFALASQRSVVSWTSMIACLVNQACSGYHDTVIVLFKKMLVLKVWPTNATFSCILKAFDMPVFLPVGMQVHGCLLKMGTEIDPALGSALLTMYGRCGGVDEIARLACRIRHDVFSRTSLLAAYARNGCNMEAVGVFKEMIMENVAIDQSVITSLLQICSSLGQLRMAKEVHCYALRTFFKLDTLLLNAIITAYSRCGDITSAENVFYLLVNKDIISWTALLTCYAQNDLAQEVLIFFREMLRRGLESPVFCITSVLRACSITTDLTSGLQIHSRAVKLGIDDDSSVENALVTLYAKCGSVRVALKIFNSMKNRDIVSWNALITSFSQHGNEVAAVQLFDLMQEEEVCPDDYTFVGLLSSCSRMGLIAEGCEYFKQMTAKYNLEPKMEHYTCMVDLFGRAGKFCDAMDFIDAMPCQPGRLVWEALLASCRLHGNVQLGRLAAKKILEIRPEDPSPYIILSNIHASVDMWDEKAWNRTVFDTQRARKDTGSSWSDVQEFSENIYGALHVGVT